MNVYIHLLPSSPSRITVHCYALINCKSEREVKEWSSWKMLTKSMNPPIRWFNKGKRNMLKAKCYE